MPDNAFVVLVTPLPNEPFFGVWPENPVRPSVLVLTSCWGVKWEIYRLEELGYDIDLF
jgi:hypothetical protein